MAFVNQLAIVAYNPVGNHLDLAYSKVVLEVGKPGLVVHFEVLVVVEVVCLESYLVLVDYYYYCQDY